MKTTLRPARTVLALSACFVALFLVVAPTAGAGPLDNVASDVTDALDDVTSGPAPVVPAPVADVGGGVGSAVAGAVGQISEAAGPATNAVEETSNTVEKVAGAVRGMAGSAKDQVTHAVTAATETVRETTEGVLDPKSTKPRHHNDGKRNDRGERVHNNANVSASADDSAVLGYTFADALESDANRPVAIATQTASASFPDESVFSQIGRIAAEAAQQMAFPMLLMLLVVGFLIAQNRIDRSDPKLALAPVESDHDLLSFS